MTIGTAARNASTGGARTRSPGAAWAATERDHITNILAKLGVHSQLQALVVAARYGVVEIGNGRP